MLNPFFYLQAIFLALGQIWANKLRSILTTLKGLEQPAVERDLFFHRREGGTRYGGLTINAVRRGDLKLLQLSHGSFSSLPSFFLLS